MGFISDWRTKKQARLAAEQMWQVISRGVDLEVPLLLDAKDLTMQAIVELQRARPEVEMRMYAARGLVIGLFRAQGRGLSADLLQGLNKAGIIAGPSEHFEAIRAETILDGHAAFLRRQGMDPKTQEQLAQADRARKLALEVNGMGKLETDTAQAPEGSTAAPVAAATPEPSNGAA